MCDYDPVVDGMFRVKPDPFAEWSILDHWCGYRMTKRQRKDQVRIAHWYYGVPFKETARAPEVVPDLSRKEVMETFIGRDVKYAAMHFTPLEMAREVSGFVDPGIWFGGRILEPCAGIGNLILPFAEVCERKDSGPEVVAYDVCETNVALGARLFPWVDWRWRVPFEDVEALSGQFDLVLMNPPYNVRRGMAPGEQMAGGRARKSEYLFLELALRAVKPGGQVAVIAPYNFWDKMPRRLREWVDARAVLEVSYGPLRGKFKTTGMQVHLFLVGRLEQEDVRPALPSGQLMLF